MADTRPVYYTDNDRQRVQAYLDEEIGRACENGLVGHELQSEYIHVDAEKRMMENGNTAYVTIGMGARRTDAPLPEYRRTELIMMTARDKPDPEIHVSRRDFLIYGELAGLSRFPFRQDTWFGHGHTVSASKQFREEFGYTHFLFLQWGDPKPLDNGETVCFLLAVPIYEKERNWMAEHEAGSWMFLHEYLERFADDENEDGMFVIDVPRWEIIPDEDKALDVYEYYFTANDGADPDYGLKEQESGEYGTGQVFI